MSPLQAMERSYAALRDLLRAGAFPPGHRLEATRLADEIGVSMTPVRDALNRLVGEQLVEASSGEGFHVPRPGEAELRDLYEWHSALAVMAARTARTAPDAGAIHEAMGTNTLADATAACFRLLATTSPNIELRTAMARAGDRLHPFRIAEARVMEPVLGELEELLDPSPRRPAAIRRYHLARMRAAGELLRARSGL
jgi:DNA-binding FadR family transcriptional regulator